MVSVYARLRNAVTYLFIYLQHSSDTLLMTDVTTILMQTDRNSLISSLWASATDVMPADTVRLTAAHRHTV